MRDVADALGEPITRTFGSVDVQFKPLTFGMLARFESDRRRELEVKNKAAVRDMAESLGEIPELSPYDRGRLMLDAHARLPQYDVLSDIRTIGGSMRILSLSAQACDPSCTEERLSEILPLSQGDVLSLIDDLLPSGTASAEEVRHDQLLVVYGKLKECVNEGDGDLRLAREATDQLGELLGIPIPPPETGEVPPAPPGGSA